MKTEWARVDPVTLEVGLFKALPKGAEPREFLGGKKHGGAAYSYAAPNHIDHIGLQVLLTLCALAAMEPTRISRAANSPLAQAAWWELATEGEAREGHAIIWRGAVSELVRECGMTTAGSNRARVLERLNQLADVRIERRDLQSGRLMAAEQLLSVQQDASGKKILVALGPHLSASVDKSQGGQYVHVCLKKLRAIDDPAGKILHAVLSNRIRESQTRLSRYGIDKLSEIAYLDAGNAAAERKRKRRVMMSMKALDVAGWGIFPPLDGQGEVYGIIRGERVDPNRWEEYLKVVA